MGVWLCTILTWNNTAWRVRVEEENGVTEVQFGLSVDVFWCSSCSDHLTWGSVKPQQTVVWHNRCKSFCKPRMSWNFTFFRFSFLFYLVTMLCSALVRFSNKNHEERVQKMLRTRLKNVFWSPHTRLETSWDLLKNTQLVSNNKAGNYTSLVYNYPAVSIIQIL